MSDQDRTPRPGDDDPRRFFTDSSSAQAANRHRRRRGPGDPTTTGSIPIVRVDKSLPDPTIEYRTPEPSAGASPYFEVRYRSSDEPTMRFTDPGPPSHPYAPSHRAPEAEPHRFSEAEPPRTTPSAPDAFEPLEARTGPIERVEPPAFGEPPHFVEPRHAAPAEPWHESGPEYTPDFDVLDPVPDEVGTAPRETQVVPPPDEPVYVDHRDEGSGYQGSGGEGRADEILPPEILTDGDDREHGGAMPERRRDKRILLGVAILALVLIVVVGGLGLRWLGVFDSRTDYDSATGTGSVLVEVPADAAIRDVGQTLADAGVVGSKRAFVDAAENGPGVAAGFYDLPRGLSARSALDMMSGDDKRVGRIIVPEGLQLDSTKSTGGQTRAGIFEMISKATTFTTDDAQYGVSVDELDDAAANSTPAELGVPDWAADQVRALTGDHRRIEGLVASGAWEDIDPRLDAKQILRELISRSVTRYTAWGLLSDNGSGRSPYDTLVIASIVEGEARKEADFPKVARVILNRLDKDQRLEMDSTANYTADLRANDVHGKAYDADNEWNTYKHEGLPPTPIGAVGDRALRATENPTPGRWLYFVTVDDDGTTLFANTFDKHKQNRQVACRNGFLKVGCE